MSMFGQEQPPQRRRMGCNPRLIMALVIAAISLISYVTMRSKNPITGQMQHVSISPQQMAFTRIPRRA